MASGSSLAAAELMVFLGLVGWLLYYQYSTSKRRPDDSGSEAEKTKEGAKRDDDTVD